MRLRSLPDIELGLFRCSKIELKWVFMDFTVGRATRLGRSRPANIMSTKPALFLQY